MAEMYYETDADLSVLEDKIIGIIGYGSQGHAHALNLRDSGLNVMVGLYDGSQSWAKAESDDLEVATVSEVAEKSDVIMMLLLIIYNQAFIKNLFNSICYLEKP